MEKQTAFIDTNYFLSLLLSRSPQAGEVLKFIEDSHANKISLVTNEMVLFEIKWVLDSYYNKPKSEIIQLLQKILRLGIVKIENVDIFAEALSIYKNKSIELEDCYNLVYAKSRKVTCFKTFDKKLTKSWNSI